MNTDTGNTARPIGTSSVPPDDPPRYHPLDLSDLSGWIADEQASLWFDLSNAINVARSGAWSMDASDCARRIIGAARLVGPTPADEIPWPLVGGGVRRAVYAAGGITLEPVDAAADEALSDEMDRLGGGRTAEHQRRYAATLEYIASERETRWLATGEDS